MGDRAARLGPADRWGSRRAWHGPSTRPRRLLPRAPAGAPPRRASGLRGLLGQEPSAQRPPAPCSRSGARRPRSRGTSPPRRPTPAPAPPERRRPGRRIAAAPPRASRARPGRPPRLEAAAEEERDRDAGREDEEPGHRTTVPRSGDAWEPRATARSDVSPRAPRRSCCDVARAPRSRSSRGAAGLVRALGRLDTMLFVITAVVVLDTVGAVAVGRPRGVHLAGRDGRAVPGAVGAADRRAGRRVSLPRAGTTSGRGSRSAGSPAPSRHCCTGSRRRSGSAARSRSRRSPSPRSSCRPSATPAGSRSRWRSSGWPSPPTSRRSGSDGSCPPPAPIARVALIALFSATVVIYAAGARRPRLRGRAPAADRRRLRRPGAGAALQLPRLRRARPPPPARCATRSAICRPGSSAPARGRSCCTPCPCSPRCSCCRRPHHRPDRLRLGDPRGVHGLRARPATRSVRVAGALFVWALDHERRHVADGERPQPGGRLPGRRRPAPARRVLEQGTPARLAAVSGVVGERRLAGDVLDRRAPAPSATSRSRCRCRSRSSRSPTSPSSRRRSAPPHAPAVERPFRVPGGTVGLWALQRLSLAWTVARWRCCCGRRTCPRLPRRPRHVPADARSCRSRCWWSAGSCSRRRAGARSPHAPVTRE